MWWRHRNTEIDRFFELLLRSGLADEADIREARVDFRLDSLEDLCSHLVDNGLITRWQCDKLLSGRHRGFFVDKYKVIDHIGKDYWSTSYLALDAVTSERVGLRFTVTDNGKMTYQEFEIMPSE